MLRRLCQMMRRGQHPGLIPRQFRRDGVIFIHVPKCAGSAFLDAYLGWQTGHITARDFHAADPVFFRSAYVFTLVRHPLARFVSAYNHISTGDLWPQLAEARTALRQHGETLTEVATGLSERSDLFQLPWFAPQHTFLELWPGGPPAVNRVFKTESFETDLQVLAAETGLRLRPLAPTNRRAPPNGIDSASLPPQAVENLRRVYSRDFTLFGYY